MKISAREPGRYLQIKILLFYLRDKGSQKKSSSTNGQARGGGLNGLAINGKLNAYFCCYTEVITSYD